jgi:hypothetical protein
MQVDQVVRFYAPNTGPQDAVIRFVHNESRVDLETEDGSVHASIRVLGAGEKPNDGESFALANVIVIDADVSELRMRQAADEFVAMSRAGLEIIDPPSATPNGAVDVSDREKFHADGSPIKTLTDADAAADLAGTQRPDNPTVDRRQSDEQMPVDTDGDD